MRKYQKAARVCLTIFSALSGLFGEDYHDVKNLTDGLLQGYSRSIIPKRNQSETIKLEMDFSLKALNKFNVVDGHMTVVTAIALKWKDELLSWDSQTNKNISELNLPLGRIWSPNLYLLNCAEQFLIYKGDPDTKEVEFSSNGEARLFFMEVFTTTCTSDIAFYPNDIHHCNIYLSTLTSASKLRMGSAKVDTLDFETNGEWNLGNTKSEHEDVTVTSKLSSSRNQKSLRSRLSASGIIPISLIYRNRLSNIPLPQTK
ncbi:neuronal acetylcholine receptor subunit beta-3-like [Saccostrea echinata]|uniref:neuronal acetylcholine receptor subunit beta-3-like n=1 Tax=Saccostrea echinata TaxID=191078 RepID=UPI002A7FDEB7|nr:neuronal acetylcholine receptor subunit beta-3-like [Saccostrea echinata]